MAYDMVMFGDKVLLNCDEMITVRLLLYSLLACTLFTAFMACMNGMGYGYVW